MATYIALFFNIHGSVVTIGLFTIDEFNARTKAAEAETKWAYLVEASTGEIRASYFPSSIKIA